MDKDSKAIEGWGLSPAVNRELSLAEYKAGVLYVNSTPQISFETTSRCNLKCVMCPHGVGGVDRPRNMEDFVFDSLKKIIKQADAVQLHGIGEPLLSPAFWDALEFISPEANNVSVNTNFIVMDRGKVERLLNSNLAAINISIDAASHLTYKRIRGADFDTLVNNIRMFIEERERRGKKNPKVIVNMTMMRSNIEEVPAFVNLAADLKADAILLGHLNRYRDKDVERFKVERDGWFFDYAAEGLWNFPALSNRTIRDAIVIAEQRGIQLNLDNNKEVFFCEERNDERSN